MIYIYFLIDTIDFVAAGLLLLLANTKKNLQKLSVGIEINYLSFCFDVDGMDDMFELKCIIIKCIYNVSSRRKIEGTHMSVFCYFSLFPMNEC